MEQRYRRMEDQKPGPDLASNQDFAKKSYQSYHLSWLRLRQGIGL